MKMDAFEHLVGRYFEERGYWIRIGYKIELTPKEKADIGNPSMPRPEIDVVAWKPSTRELLVVECKSYLDSKGVERASFNFLDQDRGGNYKLFNKQRLRNLVFAKLQAQLIAEGALDDGPLSTQLALACGKIKPGDEPALTELFQDQSWLLVTPTQIAESIRSLASKGYENDTATIVAKILQRSSP